MASCQNSWDFGLLLKLVSPRLMQYFVWNQVLEAFGPFDREARVLTENFSVSVSEDLSSFIFVIFFSCDTILITT